MIASLPIQVSTFALTNFQSTLLMNIAETLQGGTLIHRNDDRAQSRFLP